MQILLLESYDTGSHAEWMRGYQAASTHEVSILSLPGQFWKWRMHGGAVTLARMFKERCSAPDLIVASDMVDLTSFLALTREETSHTPVALYFHENQLTYPVGPRQRKEENFRLGFINYASAMAATRIFFNSGFHETSFFGELPNLLKHYPDFTELESVEGLRQKSAVLPLGLSLKRFDALRPVGKRQGLPLIVWNHRWEFDKNPRPFLNALGRLADKGVHFEVALTGENFRQHPTEFEKARQKLGRRVAQYGYLDSFEDYARLLWQADIQVSCAWHDFFGISTCEAIYCSCTPLLPRRLNYPALIPEPYHEQFLYDEGQVYYRLLEMLEEPKAAPAALSEHVAQFDWTVQAPRYDEVFSSMMER